MSRIDFDQLPDASRVWVFGVSEGLSASDEASFLAVVDGFLDGWAAHGHALRCGRDWRHGRFLLVGVDEATEPSSGCSIDALVRVLKDEQQRLGVAIVDNTAVWYLEDGEVRRVTRAEFKALADAGRVDAHTVIFDNTVTRLAEVREGGWERAARDSWHYRAFFPSSAEAVEQPTN
ncbi:MAG: hypothetical protein BMS9Abin29_0213 [Gemmatimonadota bacterium]|nr:MAG: hypothetical protein BMS9Abin29_0213 [Gemmatimonadota bacterium]